MKVTREQVAENRRRILDSASRLFRDRGFDAVTVAEVMQCAGLTHGGFYRHFASKDDLIAQTLVHCLTADIEGPFDLRAYVDGYLSPEHRDNPGGGCPFAALASQMRHQSTPARAAMTAGARDLVERISSDPSTTGETSENRAAIGSWAAMVGAIILSRAVDDRELSDRIIRETRKLVGSTMGQDCPDGTAGR